MGSNGKVLAAANRAETVSFAETVRPAIALARQEGAETLAEIAAHLNRHGVQSREGGAWHPMSVRRAISRLAPNVEAE